MMNNIFFIYLSICMYMYLLNIKSDIKNESQDFDKHNPKYKIICKHLLINSNSLFVT